MRGRNAVEDAANNNRAGLQAALFAGIKAPCNLKLVHIAAIDLHEAGVVVVFRSAAVDGPVAIVLREAGSGEEQRKCKERECFQFFTCAGCTEDITALADSSNILFIAAAEIEILRTSLSYVLTMTCLQSGLGRWLDQR